VVLELTFGLEVVGFADAAGFGVAFLLILVWRGRYRR